MLGCSAVPVVVFKPYDHADIYDRHCFDHGLHKPYCQVRGPIVGVGSMIIEEVFFIYLSSKILATNTSDTIA